MHILKPKWFGYQKLTMKDPKPKEYQILLENYFVGTNIEAMQGLNVDWNLSNALSFHEESDGKDSLRN